MPDSPSVAAGYMWFECYAKYPGMKRILLVPGVDEDRGQVFDKKGPDGELYITERLLSFFDHTICASVTAKLGNEDIMEYARAKYYARVKAYTRRSRPVLKDVSPQAETKNSTRRVVRN